MVKKVIIFCLFNPTEHTHGKDTPKHMFIFWLDECIDQIFSIKPFCFTKKQFWLIRYTQDRCTENILKSYGFILVIARGELAEIKGVFKIMHSPVPF